MGTIVRQIQDTMRMVRVQMSIAQDLQRLPNGEWPDPVKRIKDEMDMHAILGQRGFVAIALEDGKPLDHACYPTWSDAVKVAKWDRDRYMFPEVQPDGMTHEEAASVLDFARKLYAGGYRIPNPEWTDHQATAMPLNPYDRKRMARQLITGRPILPADVPYGNLPNIGRFN